MDNAKTPKMGNLGRANQEAVQDTGSLRATVSFEEVSLAGNNTSTKSFFAYGQSKEAFLELFGALTNENFLEDTMVTCAQKVRRDDCIVGTSLGNLLCSREQELEALKNKQQSLSPENRKLLKILKWATNKRSKQNRVTRPQLVEFLMALVKEMYNADDDSASFSKLKQDFAAYMIRSILTARPSRDKYVQLFRSLNMPTTNIPKKASEAKTHSKQRILEKIFGANCNGMVEWVDNFDKLENQKWKDLEKCPQNVKDLIEGHFKQSPVEHQVNTTVTQHLKSVFRNEDDSASICSVVHSTTNTGETARVDTDNHFGGASSNQFGSILGLLEKASESTTETEVLREVVVQQIAYYFQIAQFLDRRFPEYDVFSAIQVRIGPQFRSLITVPQHSASASTIALEDQIHVLSPTEEDWHTVFTLEGIVQNGQKTRAWLESHAKRGGWEELSKALEVPLKDPETSYERVSFGLEWTMDDFILVGIIDKGAFGVVGKVRHKSCPEVALAAKFEEFTPNNYPEYFVRPLACHGKVHHHRNVISLFGWFVGACSDNNKVIGVTIMNEGRCNLRAKIKELHQARRLNKETKFEVAISYMLQLMEALKCFKENDILHRDLKPENILFDFRDVLQVTDMGLARTAANDSTLEVGTPPYMAPELRDENANTTSSTSMDMFSAGVIFYEIITKKLPRNHSETMVPETAFEDFEKALPSNSNLEMLDELLREMLESDPDKRIGPDVASDKLTEIELLWSQRAKP